MSCSVMVCANVVNVVCYILICPYFRLNRELYIKPYYYRRPSMMKFEQLFSSKNKRTLSKLAKFITLIMKQF